MRPLGAHVYTTLAGRHTVDGRYSFDGHDDQRLLHIYGSPYFLPSL